MKRLYSLIFVLTLVLGCKMDYVAEVTDLQLVKLKPAAAYEGSVVKILGRNFSSGRSGNVVMIGEKRAQVIEVDKWQLSVVVPELEPGEYDVTVETASAKRGGLQFLCQVRPDHVYVSSVFVGESGKKEEVDGTGTEAHLVMPEGLIPDGNGDFYILQRATGISLRKMTAAGVVTTVETTGEALNFPWQGAVSPSGELYICNKGNNKLLKMDAAGRLSAVPGFSLNQPMGVAFDSEGNGYIANRDYTADGTKGQVIKFKDDKPVATFAIQQPTCVAVDALNRVLVGSQSSGYLWMVNTDGTIKKLAGDGNISSKLGDGIPGDLKNKSSVGVVGGIFCAKDGSVFFTDQTAKSVRKLVADSKADYSKGTLETIATGFFPSDIVATDDVTKIFVSSATTQTVRLLE